MLSPARFGALVLVASMVFCALASAQPTVRPTVAPGVTFQKLNVSGADRILNAISSNPTVNNQANKTTGINWTEILKVSTMPYTDLLGNVAFAIPFLMMALRQQNSLIPMICGCVLGTFLLAMMPPEYRLAGVTFIALSVLAAVYGLFRER
jgi:hypothetical protein